MRLTHITVVYILISYSFNAWGVTIVDSLDTMYLMGLTDEFNRGLAFVETMEFWMPPVRRAYVFAALAVAKTRHRKSLRLISKPSFDIWVVSCPRMLSLVTACFLSEQINWR